MKLSTALLDLQNVAIEQETELVAANDLIKQQQYKINQLEDEIRRSKIITNKLKKLVNLLHSSKASYRSMHKEIKDENIDVIDSSVSSVQIVSHKPPQVQTPPKDNKSSKSKLVRPIEVIRCKKDRKRLHGQHQGCCEGYYEATGDARQQTISRHRNTTVLPSTPDGYWEESFE